MWNHDGASGGRGATGRDADPLCVVDGEGRDGTRRSWLGWCWVLGAGRPLLQHCGRFEGVGKRKRITQCKQLLTPRWDAVTPPAPYRISPPPRAVGIRNPGWRPWSAPRGSGGVAPGKRRNAGPPTPPRDPPPARQSGRGGKGGGGHRPRPRTRAPRAFWCSASTPIDHSEVAQGQDIHTKPKPSGGGTSIHACENTAC